METKLEKFERIAERRVNEAVRVLRLIANLADKRNYEYTEQHVNQVLSTIDNEVRIMKARFRNDADDVKKEFKFRARG